MKLLSTEERNEVIIKSALLPGLGHLQIGEAFTGSAYLLFFAAGLQYAFVRVPADNKRDVNNMRQGMLSTPFVLQDARRNGSIPVEWDQWTPLLYPLQQVELKRINQKAAVSQKRAYVLLAAIWTISFLHIRISADGASSVAMWAGQGPGESRSLKPDSIYGVQLRLRL